MPSPVQRRLDLPEQRMQLLRLNYQHKHVSITNSSGIVRSAGITRRCQVLALG